ncbi:MAG: hypothetical protein JWR11_2938 [Mycobacterium sp.]|jgi:hypothetical protein|nr:hypothetical protein [Mycobacterium sp.]
MLATLSTPSAPASTRAASSAWVPGHRRRFVPVCERTPATFSAGPQGHSVLLQQPSFKNLSYRLIWFCVCWRDCVQRASRSSARWI